jgi:hypothetical protein
VVDRPRKITALNLVQTPVMAKELYIGTFVHSLKLNELEIGEKGVIGVKNGKISFVEKNIEDLSTLVEKHGFEGAKVCQC